MGIDLPVISSDFELPGAEPGFPLCNVAMYFTPYGQPSEEGTTYIYAHAREGMFLPLLEASRRGDGSELIGTEVIVYTEAGLAYRYEIFEFDPDATDFSLADDVAPGEQRLVLQTSVGPRGTHPKLMMAARLIEVTEVSQEEARPSPDPQACS